MHGKEPAMKVEMTFNNAAVSSNGYNITDIYQTIKKSFIGSGLKCCSEDDTLSFEDGGRENDYANMWKLILSLLRSPWFIKCASSCVFVDDDDSEEDVLSQAWKAQKQLA